VEVHGRVGALLELGAGFHPEYTGRENIATAAALYGLSDQELAQKLGGIVAFADIGRYIDEPIKHYSSGMIVRLGFAVVAAVRPDLLITDEVLAVGDESFQKKCVRWMEDYLDEGGTLILVSHSMYHIQKLCRQALWLRQGHVEASGEASEVCQAYLAYHERKSAQEGAALESDAEKAGLEFRLVDLALNGVTASGACLLPRKGTLVVRVRMSSRDGRVPVVHLSVVRADGTPVFGINSDMDGVQPAPAEDGYSIALRLPDLPLLPGSYTVKAHVLDTEGLRLFDTLESHFTVSGRGRELGLVALEHSWEQALPLAHREPSA
jgi:lipopolysaccharide transport system ATP-binding protein